MLIKMLTLNICKKRHDVKEIEKEFELTRANYLRDLNRIRKKYKGKFMKLTSAYGNAST